MVAGLISGCSLVRGGPWWKTCVCGTSGGLLSSPITSGRFLAPCPHTPLLTFPDHPLSHPCQATPTLNVANVRSMKCTIYHAVKFRPMGTLRRGWSLFNETACLRSPGTARESSDTQQPLHKRNRSRYAQPPTLNMHCWWDHYSKNIQIQ